MSRRRFFSPVTLAVAALSLVTACEPPVSSDLPTSPPAGDSTTAATAAHEDPSAETWDVIHMNRQPVGYQSLRLQRLSRADGGDDVLDATASSALTIQRFGQVTRETMEMTSRETLDGQVVTVMSSIQSGESRIETVGRRDGDTFRLESRSGEQVHRWSLELPPRCGGYFAVEWSLRQHPLIAGEQRKLHTLVPVLNQIAEITLLAGDRETVELLHGTAELTRVDQHMSLPGGMSLDSVSWIDERGDILKTQIAALHQASFRVDREAALAAAQESSFDLGEFSTVRLQNPLVDPRRTKKVRYRVMMSPRIPDGTFARTASQTVSRLNESVADVTVFAIRPDDDGGPSLDEPRPGAAERESSAMIQSDSPDVLTLADQIRPLADDAWSIAVATERFVFETLTQKDFSTAFATAADVARTRRGDCTEHAVLTAALCRAQGVPARVLVGLVYVASQQAFVFHMWNEVWVSDRWIPIDATLGDGGIPATHLVLVRSSLETGDAFSALLPVMRILGHLDIEVVDTQYEDRVDSIGRGAEGTP